MTPACMAALGSKLPENANALAVQQFRNRFPLLWAVLFAGANLLTLLSRRTP
jgi:hypothetical protein